MRKLRFRNSFLVLLFGIATLTACSDEDDSTLGVWYNRSDFDGLARADASSFTIDNKGYVCFGYTGKKRLTDLWEYDIDRDSWTQMASLPETDREGNGVKGRNSATAFAINGKGYVGTGYNGEVENSGYIQDFWEFDPLKNQWAQKADFPGGRRRNAVGFGIGQYGYMGTGYDGNYQKDFYRYDPTSDVWTKITSINGSKRMGASAFVIDDKGYVCCGINNGSYVEDFWRYNPESQEWEELAKISNTNTDENKNDVSWDDDYASIVRQNGVIVVIDGKAVLSTGSNGSLVSYTWLYDPTTDRWEEMTGFAGSARSSAVGISNGAKGLFATGRSSSYYFDDVWEINRYEYEDNE